jgi:hypothetical protein
MVANRLGRRAVRFCLRVGTRIAGQVSEKNFALLNQAPCRLEEFCGLAEFKAIDVFDTLKKPTPVDLATPGSQKVRERGPSQPCCRGFRNALELANLFVQAVPSAPSTTRRSPCLSPRGDNYGDDPRRPIRR